MTNEATKTKEEGSESNDRLYAGKFKTVEDMEVGYKNASAVYEENQTLKKQIEDFTNIPADYINPADVELEESRLTDIKSRAKEAGMTQAQYEKFVRSDKARIDQRKQSFEAAKKEVGEETINILKDYVGKHYPEPLRANMLNTFIGNKEARLAALQHRDQLLNNRVPGMERTSAVGYTVTDKDIKKAYEAKEANKGDMKAREHYMNLLAAKSAQDGS